MSQFAEGEKEEKGAIDAIVTVFAALLRSTSLHVVSPKSQQTTVRLSIWHILRGNAGVCEPCECTCTSSACGVLIEGLPPREYRGHLQFKWRLLYSSTVRPPRDSPGELSDSSGEPRRLRSTARSTKTQA